MPYDEELAHRIRELIGVDPRVSEKKMFGGLAFLVDGRMAIAASGQGGVLVRVDPGDRERLLRTTKAEPAVMRGRPMRGWLRVAPEHLAKKEQLRPWVRRGVDHASSLPAEPSRRGWPGGSASRSPRRAPAPGADRS